MNKKTKVKGVVKQYRAILLEVDVANLLRSKKPVEVNMSDYILSLIK